MMIQTIRFSENPIIYPELDPSIGSNINGPSLIRVPDWIASPLGRYYLYFGHHQGKFIRLAYADDLHGPWHIHTPGALHLDQTACINHIASPDVHVDDDRRVIVLYFHGVTSEGQRSFRAVSKDGLSFQASSTILGPFYFRVFRHDGSYYAIAKTVVADGGGLLLRSEDGKTAFEQGQDVLPRQRHVAVQKLDDRLRVFYSRGEDRPERILMSEMDLTGDWRSWTPGDPVDVLAPEEAYEGVDLPLEPSRFGAVHGRVRQLRDPAIFEEDGRTYLVYSSAGESGLCLAELHP